MKNSKVKCMKGKSCKDCEHGGRDDSRAVTDGHVREKMPVVCTKFRDGEGLPVFAAEVRGRFEECEHFEAEKEVTDDDRIASMLDGLPPGLRDTAERVMRGEPCACEDCQGDADTKH